MRYSAFISYRHGGRDGRWARWLHARLESFRLPPDLREEGGPERMTTRIFRDEDELGVEADLPTAIDAALRDSRHLIVICSPRTSESRWIRQEIDRFVALGGADRILPVLIEGEVSEVLAAVLPEAGTSPGSPPGRASDPLAADVRAPWWRILRRRDRKRHALLKLLAALLGLRFDDLRRRAEERAARRLRRMLAVAIALMAAFAATATYAFVQREEAKQSELRAQERMADALESEGAALENVGHWRDARMRHREARAVRVALGQSTFASDLALLETHRRAPLPLHGIRATDRPLESIAVTTADGGPSAIAVHRGGLVATWNTLGGTILAGNDLGSHAPLVVAALEGHGLLAMADTGSVSIYEPAGREASFTQTPPRIQERVFCLGASSREPVVAAGTWEGSVVWWNFREPRGYSVWPPESERPKDGNPVWKVAVAPDASRLAMVTGGAEVQDLLLIDGAKATLEGQVRTEGIGSLLFSHDGKRLFVGAADGSIAIWDMRTLRLERTLKGHRGPVNALATTSDERWLASGGGDQAVILWDLPSGREVARYVDHANAVLSLAFDERARLLLSGDGSGYGWCWSYPPEGDPFDLDALTHSAFALAVAPEGDLLVTAGNQGPVSLWDARHGLRLETYRPSGSLGEVVAFDAGPRHVAVGYIPEAILETYDLRTGERRGPWQVPMKGLPRIYGLALSPDGEVAYVGTAIGEVVVTSATTGQVLRRFGGRVDDTLSWAFDRSVSHALVGGTRYVAGERDGRKEVTSAGVVHLYDCADGRVRWSRTYDGQVRTVALSPDARWAAVNAGDMQIHAVETRSGGRSIDIPMSDVLVHSMAFADGDRYLFAAGREGVHVIDLAVGRELRRLPVDEGVVNPLCVTHGGRRLYVGTSRGQIMVWDLDRVAALEEAAPWVLRHRDDWQDFARSPSDFARLGGWLEFRARADLALGAFRRIDGWKPPSATAQQAAVFPEDAVALEFLRSHPASGVGERTPRDALFGRALASVVAAAARERLRAGDLDRAESDVEVALGELTAPTRERTWARVTRAMIHAARMRSAKTDVDRDASRRAALAQLAVAAAEDPDLTRSMLSDRALDALRADPAFPELPAPRQEEPDEPR